MRPPRPISLMLMATLGGCPAPPEALVEAEAATAAIPNRVVEFGEAFARADTTALSASLTDGYVHTNNDGTVLDKLTWLAWVQGRHEALRAGRLTIDEYLTDSVRVVLYGTNAVVTALHSSTGVADGEPFRVAVRSTQFWVLEHGQWRRAAFHDSQIAP